MDDWSNQTGLETEINIETEHLYMEWSLTGSTGNPGRKCYTEYMI